MTLKNSFCSSPWFHMRINNAGNYEYCRWMEKGGKEDGSNIREVTPAAYFQDEMSPIRQQLLEGNQPVGCQECSKMEQHGKISGRQKQLLKVGVRLEQFEKTLVSSPWVKIFADTEFTQLPQDWQIDLGNYCNSACVFCSPHSSSKIATEWKRIGFIDTLPPPNWTADPALVDKFVDTLTQSKHIQYLHFIGGETLITPAFKTILEALIQAGLNRTATIGFTTNLITWDDDVVELLKQFNGVNLGMSIEAFKIVNDYARWPATLPKIYEVLEKWEALAKQHGWLMQFRTTPTVLTVSNLLSVYEYAWHRNVPVESCNFLSRPEFMRPSVLPPAHRQKVIAEMEHWLAKHKVESDQIVNTRDPNVAKPQIVQDLQSYVNYLKNEPDESYRLPELVAFLKQLEASRGNSITTYLPEYEELFRSAGY